MSTDPANVDPPLPCPQCQRATDSLKVFTAPTVLFLVLAWAVQRNRVVACPACMRKRVWTTSLVNVPTANLLWPLVILPWTMIELYLSTRAGHSKEILSRLHPEAIPATATAVEREASSGPSRAWGVAKIIFGLCGALLPTYFLIEYWYDWGNAIWLWGVAAAVGVGLACGIVISGFANVRRAVTPRKSLAGLGLLAAIVFLAASPLVARAYWKSKAADYAEAGQTYDYLTRVPVQVWTPEAAEKVVDWKVEALTRDSAGADADDLRARSAYEDVKDIYAKVERQHGSSAEFRPLLERLRGVLAEYKRFGERLVPREEAEAIGGEFGAARGTGLSSPLNQGAASP